MLGTNDILTHRTSVMFISGDNVCQEPNCKMKMKKKSSLMKHQK